ncbi:MAG: DUF2497 domain-containing protein [Filomicrobium sp.]
MSTTNGGGEPSMEEILASIRNIIAQEPVDNEPSAAPTQSQGAGKSSAVEPATVASPNSSDPLSSSPSSSPQPLGQSFASRPSQTGSSGVGSKPATLSQSLSSSVGGTGPTGVKPGSAAPADDFSDVFEEPLGQVTPLAASPFSVKPTDKSVGPVSNTPADGPTLPKSGTGGSSGPTVIASQEPVQPVLPISAGAPESEIVPSPVLPEGNSGSIGTGGTGSGFDFGAFRARSTTSPDASAEAAPKPVSDLQPELDEPQEEESLEQTIAKLKAKTDQLQKAHSAEQLKGETPVSSSADSGKADEPGAPVVIAAMSGKPNEAESSAASEVKDEVAADIGSDNDESDAANAAGVDTPAANGAASLVNGLSQSNVGFLASQPRPLSTESGSISEVASETAAPVDTTDVAETVTAVDGTEADAEATKAEPAVLASMSSSAADTPATSLEPVAAPEATDATVSEPKETGLEAGLTAANIVVSNQGGSVKTLEDTVAELLRPLLREWLENNMPRIVENALRLEVADSVKKQLEITTRKPNGLDHK